MKKYLSVMITSLLLTHGAFAQTDEQQIASIDKIRQEIKNKMASLTLTENLENTERGYSKRVYKQGNDLRLISIAYKDKREAGKNIQKNVEWYFSNGNLIYTEQIWTEPETNKVINHERLYLDDKRLISWIKSENNKVDTTSAEFKETDVKLRLYGLALAQNSK